MSGRGEMRKRRREKRVTFTKGILAGQVTYKDMPLKHIHTHTRTHAHTHTHTFSTLVLGHSVVLVLGYWYSVVLG